MKFSLPVLMAFCLLGCGSDNKKEAGDSVRSVYVVRPEGGSDSYVGDFSTAVEEGKSVNASFKTGGQIKKLYLKEGDRVSKGMVIGALDDTEYRLSLRQIEAQYEQTESELRRLDEMFRRSNIAPNDYEKAKAGFEQLKTQLQIVKTKLAYTHLEAPASGYIVEQYMEEGEMAGAGTPIYRILDNTAIETSVALPASLYSRRDKITRCVGNSAVTGNSEIPLEIISFIPDGDNNSLFRLRLRIPSEYREKLLPGMNMTVSLNLASDEGRATSVVPSRALFERNGKEYVWIVNPKDSTLSAREVRSVGNPTGPNSVVEGLDGNETIVAAGVHHLSDKEKVRILGEISALM